MNIARYLRPELIRLGLVGGHIDTIDPELDLEQERARLKEEVIEELADLFCVSGEIRNPTRFRKDFVQRERRSSTGLENGVALPHLRSLQPRKTVMIFVRTRDGVWFDSLDRAPTHLFFGITAPPYDDRELLRFFKWISSAFVSEPWLKDALLNAEDGHEILMLLGRLR